MASSITPPLSFSGCDSSRAKATCLPISTNFNPIRKVSAERTIREGSRNGWSRDEIKADYESPVLDLLFHGVEENSPLKAEIERSTVELAKYISDESLRQKSNLGGHSNTTTVSYLVYQPVDQNHSVIKLDADSSHILAVHNHVSNRFESHSEDCSYCPQSSRYSTKVKAQRLMSKDIVIEAAKKVLRSQKEAK